MKTLVDLETHVRDHLYDATWFNGDPYTREDLPDDVVAKCFDTADSTLLGIIDFHDGRAERIFSRLIFKGNYEVETKGSMLLTAHKGNKQAHLIKGQEIPTDKGHLVIIGSEREIKSGKLDDVLKEAKDNGALIVVDHPMLELPLAAKSAFALLGYKHLRLSLNEDDIEKYKEQIDGIEVWNGNNSRKMNNMAQTISLMHNIPGYVTSDSHSLNSIFSSYMILESLDFSNAQNLIASLRESVKKPHESVKKYVFLEKERHGLAGLVELFLEKTRLVKLNTHINS